MKVMIVGAAGFVGSSVAIQLLKHTSFQIASVDDLSTTEDAYNIESARRATSRHTFYVADAADGKIMRKLLKLEKPDILLFCLEMDAEGQLIVKDLAKIAEAVLPDLQKTIIVCSHPEQTGDYSPLQILPDFSMLKNHIVVSTCRIFGSRQHSRHFIPKTIYEAIGLAEPTIKTNNHDPQEWLYIGDLFRGILAIIVTSHNASYYCIASGSVETQSSIASKIYSIVGKPSVESNHSSFLSNTLDCSEIRELGWLPTYKIDDALEHTARWFSDNHWACR